MLDNFPPLQQPSLQSLVQRISHELSAKAVMLLHENGQVLQRSGWVEEGEYPAIAALVAAMIAAGKSLSAISETFQGSPSRFGCDSDAMGLYTVMVAPSIWLAVIYEQPLNPGLFRMKVRRHAETLARLGVARAEQWEFTPEGPGPRNDPLPKNGSSGNESGAILSPVSSTSPACPEKITQTKPSLFGNITDEEIDELFENPSS